MTTKVSAKYQIVIPKAVRKRLDIQPGQKLSVEAATDGSVIMRKAGYNESGLSRYAGVIKTHETEWGKNDVDAAEWLRKQRNEEWK